MTSIEWTANAIKALPKPKPKNMDQWHADLVCDALCREGEMTSREIRDRLDISGPQLQRAVKIALRDGRVKRDWAGPKGFVIREAA